MATKMIPAHMLPYEDSDFIKRELEYRHPNFFDEKGDMKLKEQRGFMSDPNEHLNIPFEEALILLLGALVVRMGE